MNLRAGEAGDVDARTARRGGAKPILIGDVGVRVMQRDGLHHADVVVAFERGERDGVGAFGEEAGVDRECVGDVGLAGEIHFADGRAVEADGDAMSLAFGGALQGDVDADGQRGIGSVVGDGEGLVDRLGGDGIAEEIVLVFAIQQRGEIGGAVFANHGEGETLRVVQRRQSSSPVVR